MVANSPESLAAAPAPVFIIHADADAWFVEGQLVPALGLPAQEVRLSSKLPLGELTLHALARNIAECRATLVVVSHATAAEAWAEHAATLASHAAVEGAARVIPLLREEKAGELWLRAHVSIDLSKAETRESELRALARYLGAREALSAAEIACPYPGMRALGPRDGSLLFGRDAEISKIAAALLAGQRELVLVGASGSGKSSLVHAGVLPKLAKGRWRELVVRSLRPGQHPVQRLQEALLAEGEPGAWEDRAAQLLRHGGDEARLLVVIDQLEEAFALAEPAEREAFFSALIALRSHPRCHLIFCLRADFLGKLISSSLWRGRTVAHQLIEPLGGDSLRSAIVVPACHAGVSFEPALIERLVAEAEASDHSLPLLQAALVQLWDERERRLLSLAAYQRLCGEKKNGLGAAMSRHADACLAELSPAQQKIARRVLLRLVSFGEGSDDSRWARPRAELGAAGESEAELEAVLEHLTRARLVVRDGGEGEEEQRVDLTHEALLSSWGKLAEWIGALRADGQRRRQLEHTAAVWAVRGRGTAGLLDGRELSESGQWRKSEPARELGQSAELTAFFDASERAQHSRMRRGRAAAGVAAALVGLALAAVLVAWSAVSGREEAEQVREVAVAERQRSEIQRVRSRARSELADQMPQRALPLLMQARDLGGRAPLDFAMAAMFREALRAPLVARQAHGSAVTAIALSPDGAQFASATVAGELHLWRTADGGAIGEPLHHARGAITDVAYFPDGRHLVSCGEDGTARVWDASGRATGQVLNHGAPLRVVKVSPDGRTVVTGGDDGRAILWSASTGAAIARMVHRGSVGGAAFSRDSTLVAPASDDHSARVWRVRDGLALTKPLPHQDNLVSIDISPDNQRLLTANADKGAKVWQLRTGTSVFDIAVPRGLSWAEYSPDGAQILTAADNKWAGRWSARDGSTRGDAMSHRGGVNAARYSGDGNRIATASNDKTARVWERSTGRSLTSPLQHEGKVVLLAINRDGSLVVTASEDRNTYVWKIDVPAAELVSFSHEDAVNDVSFSRDGAYLATASADKKLRLWNAVTGELVLMLPHFGEVFLVAISPDRQLIATATGKTARLWRPTGELVEMIEHEDYVRGIAFDRSGALFFSAARDGELRGTELRNGSQRFRASLAEKIACLALSPDGTKLAVGTEDGSIRLWDVPSRRPLSVAFKHIERVESLQFSEDGALLLSASGDRRAQVWSLRDEKVALTLAHKDPVSAARFSPDGRWIATASRRFVILWDAESGEEVVRRTFSDWMFSVEWSPDGTWLAMGGKQDLVERWILDDGAIPLEERRELAAAGGLIVSGDRGPSAPAHPSRLTLQCFDQTRRELEMSAARTLLTGSPRLASCLAARPPLPGE